MKRIPLVSSLINCVILSLVFGKAILVSLFEAGKHYVTKTSILLGLVLIVGFVGLYFASKYYESAGVQDAKKIAISVVLNILCIMAAFMMLLQGALIV